MAITTDYLHLAKPEYTDAADIAVLNTDLDMIDQAIETVTEVNASKYSSSSTYVVGDLCTYNLELYRCNTAISTAEQWNSNHWTKVKISDLLATEKTERISDVSKLKSDLGIVEDTDTATHNITIGQYVIWKGELYTASTAITSGDTLSASTNLTSVSSGGLNSLSSNITIIRKKTALYQSEIPANGTVTQILSNAGITPDVISGYSLIGAFPMVNLDLITVGYNANSDYVSMHNWNTETQRTILSMIYIYTKN